MIFMTSIKELKEEIEKLKERNKRVEADKAWETSFARKVLIAIATYIIISLFLWVAKIPEPLINAVVPTIAFFISTLTIPFFKSLWLKYIYKRK